MNSVERNANECLFQLANLSQQKEGNINYFAYTFEFDRWTFYVKTHVNHKIHEMDHNEEHLGRKHMEYCNVSLVIGATKPL